MNLIPGYSPYESMLASYTLIASFAVKGDYSEDDITKCWINLQKQYPYLQDYTTITSKKNEMTNYNNNIPIKFDIKKETSISDALDEIKDNLSKEIIHSSKAGIKHALLAYSKIIPCNICLFSLYVSHSRTDLKSISFLVTAFLNHLEDITKEIEIYSMESIYPTLLDKKLIPEESDRPYINKKFFNYKQPLKFDYMHIKNNIQFTLEEKAIIEKESKYHNEPIYFISRSIKYTSTEMAKIREFCKNKGLSVQALLDAAYLKSALEFFENNINESDVINFQIIFDHRIASIGKEKCIGNFPEAAYPYLPIEYFSKSIIEIASALTQNIKEISSPNVDSSLYSEAFNRYRLECYCGSNEEYKINFSFSTSNLGKFKCLDDLTPNMKNNFIDFKFVAGSQYPIPNNVAYVSSHMYGLFDESANHTMHFPYAVVYTPYVLKFLEHIKELMLNC